MKRRPAQYLDSPAKTLNTTNNAPTKQDVAINVLLTVLGFVPGVIHAVYIIVRY